MICQHPQYKKQHLLNIIGACKHFYKVEIFSKNKQNNKNQNKIITTTLGINDDVALNGAF